MPFSIHIYASLYIYIFEPYTYLVQEILRQSVSIRSALQLDNIAVVFDQALYAKATSIAWRHPEQCGTLTLMLENFHSICNLLSTIGKLFGDAGLRDLAVESGVIAEGSINKILDGKQYNRAVRLHKLTYEALMRLCGQALKNGWRLTMLKLFQSTMTPFV